MLISKYKWNIHCVSYCARPWGHMVGKEHFSTYFMCVQVLCSQVIKNATDE